MMGKIMTVKDDPVTAVSRDLASRRSRIAFSRSSPRTATRLRIETGDTTVALERILPCSAGFGVRSSMYLAPPVQLVAQVSRFGVRRR